MFLRNHDELTLEMVTDEERDYMWRVYANDPTARINLGIRRRLAPLLANSRRKIELLNILLCSCLALRFFITATKSVWATIFILAIATVAARQCNGAPIGMPAFPKPIRNNFICRLRLILNTTTKRLTSKISRRISHRCSGGCEGLSRCARITGRSLAVRSNFCFRKIQKCSSFCAAPKTRRSWW